MYLVQTQALFTPPGTEYRITGMTNADFIRALRQESGFRSFYNDLLAVAPYPAFYWEHPVLQADRMKLPYEFSLLPSRSLATVTAERGPFAEFFAGREPSVTFPNLRGDAQLIVPDGNYTAADFLSLADLVRSDRPELTDHFWQTVGEQLHRLVDQRPVYLNTAGNGVYWCHVRLDSRPKYYKRREYRA